MARAKAPELSVTEWAVLGVITEATTHGFAVARELGPDGDLGRVWTVHRPLVYRAVDRLHELGLVEATGSASGPGPQRRLFRATRSGRTRLRSWLATPVTHVRDARSHLLLKLALLDRAGRAPDELIHRQQAVVTPLLAGLEAQLTTAIGFAAVMLRWRLESARALQRFLAEIAPD